MATHKIRVTLHPDTELEVTDEEKTDLERHGLLVDQDNSTPQQGQPAQPRSNPVATSDKEK